jgi:valyl-tRNA synthetase
MIPFVTEALWTSLTGGDSLVLAEWPKPDPSRADESATAEVALIRDAVTEGRRFRSEQGVKPSQRVPARVTGAPPYAEAAIRSLLRLDEPGEGFAATAQLPLASGVSIAFDLSGAIDIAAERARLAKARAVAEKERATNAAKLGNESFSAKAPEAVIAKVRDRLAAAEAELARIDAALAALPSEPS